MGIVNMDNLGEIQPPLDERGDGFLYDNCRRNQFLEQKGFKQPISLKTGTTIAGCVFKDGVVLGADTRATEGPIVCDKNCEKIHYIASNIYCCGAGTSADTENTTGLVSSQLELHRLATEREPKVVTAMTLLKRFLFRYQGYISAALVLGGVDSTGPHLYSVWPHGSTTHGPYLTMGSGSLAAMAVFESTWKEDLEEADAMKLVHDAICAGIFNDLGSGSNVDLVVLKKDQTDIHRTYDAANPKGVRSKAYNFPRGTTEVLRQERRPMTQKTEDEDEGAEEGRAPMET